MAATSPLSTYFELAATLDTLPVETSDQIFSELVFDPSFPNPKPRLSPTGWNETRNKKIVDFYAEEWNGHGISDDDPLDENFDDKDDYYRRLDLRRDYLSSNVHPLLLANKKLNKLASPWVWAAVIISNTEGASPLSPSFAHGTHVDTPNCWAGKMGKESQPANSSSDGIAYGGKATRMDGGPAALVRLVKIGVAQYVKKLTLIDKNGQWSSSSWVSSLQYLLPHLHRLKSLSLSFLPDYFLPIFHTINSTDSPLSQTLKHLRLQSWLDDSEPQTLDPADFVSIIDSLSSLELIDIAAPNPESNRSTLININNIYYSTTSGVFPSHVASVLYSQHHTQLTELRLQFDHRFEPIIGAGKSSEWRSQRDKNNWYIKFREFEWPNLKVLELDDAMLPPDELTILGIRDMLRRCPSLNYLSIPATNYLEYPIVEYDDFRYVSILRTDADGNHNQTQLQNIHHHDTEDSDIPLPFLPPLTTLRLSSENAHTEEMVFYLPTLRRLSLHWMWPEPGHQFEDEKSFPEWIESLHDWRFENANCNTGRRADWYASPLLQALELKSLPNWQMAEFDGVCELIETTGATWVSLRSGNSRGKHLWFESPALSFYAYSLSHLQSARYLRLQVNFLAPSFQDKPSSFQSPAEQLELYNFVLECADALFVEPLGPIDSLADQNEEEERPQAHQREVNPNSSLLDLCPKLETILFSCTLPAECWIVYNRLDDRSGGGFKRRDFKGDEPPPEVFESPFQTFFARAHETPNKGYTGLHYWTF